MIKPRVIDAALIPGPAISTVASESVVSAVVTEFLVSAAVTGLVALTEDLARLPMAARVGRRRPNADTQPKSGQAQRDDDSGFDDYILQTHRVTPWFSS